MERESQYTISSVKKALKVLKLFDSAHKSMTLTEISERADMRKGTMVRVLTTLEEEGFVRYDEISKRYSLGMSISVYKRCGSCQALSGEGYNRTESDCPSVCA